MQRVKSFFLKQVRSGVLNWWPATLHFVAQCGYLACEFGLRKIVQQKKKNLLSLNYVKIAMK